MKERIAVIDLGSNSVRLVLMEINEDGSYRMLNELKEVVRLSENMGENNILTDVAMKRTIDTIKLFKLLCDANETTNILAVATAAVRNASNKDEFLNTIYEETGINFDVISGEEEAELGFLGVSSTMDIEEGFIIDIGGASTEITRFKDRGIKDSLSLPFGAVTLTERFLNKDVCSEKQIQVLEEFIFSKFKEYKWLKNEKSLPLVGVGGTIRSISKIDRRNKLYLPDIVHNYVMSRQSVTDIYESIRYINIEERRQIPGMAKDRVDIIVAGICVVNCLLKYLSINSLIVSGSGLREGIFFNYYLKRKNLDRIDNVRDFSIQNLLKLYSVNTKHALHVRNLSMKLFEELLDIHKMGEYEKEVFYNASLVHDVGISIDFYNRDKHTYYLICNSRLNGFSHREILMCALVAARFSNENLKKYYNLYRNLFDKEDLKSIRKMITLLAICDKLDRSKSGVIFDINCEIHKDRVVINTIKEGQAELEICEANKQKPWFKKVFGKDLLIV